jgi:hypothetical protein
MTSREIPGKRCVRIDVCLAPREELRGALIGPDGIVHRFTGWMQLVSALEAQRSGAHEGRRR